MRIAYLPEYPDRYQGMQSASPVDRRRLAALTDFWGARGAELAPFGSPGFDPDLLYFVTAQASLPAIRKTLAQGRQRPAIVIGITEDVLTADWATFDTEDIDSLERIAEHHFAAGKLDLPRLARDWLTRLRIPLTFKARMLMAVAAADMVICASEAQAASLRHINPFCIGIAEAIPPAEFMPEQTEQSRQLREAKQASGKVSIVWEGTAWGLHLLELIRKPLERLHLESAVPFEFVVVMPNQRPATFHGSDDNAELLASRFACPVRHIAWDAGTIGSVLRACDIGVAPMAILNPFYAAKAHNKPAVYMGMGLPVIASDILAYRNLISHGVDGFLAKTPDDWLQSLRILVENPARRKDAGIAARAKFDERCSVETVAGSFYQAFEIARDVAAVRRRTAR